MKTPAETASKRLVIVSPYFHAGVESGAKVRATNLSPQIGSLVGHATVLSPFEIEGADHIPFDLDGPLWMRALKLIGLNRTLHRLRPSVVISESPLCPISLGRFRTVHVIHDTKYLTRFGRRGRSLARLLHAISVRLADVVLTVSQAEAATIAKFYGIGDKVLFSYNGIGSTWFDTPKARRENDCEFDIIYVSNFAPHKGHADLLRATEKASYRIALVGSDFGMLPAIQALAAHSRSTIAFFSNVSERDLIALYDRSKIMVFPSRLEGFGMPYLEARSRGLPVVANDIPVFRELSSLLGGIIVDCAERSALAKAIEAALDGPLRAFPDGAVLQRFHWAEITRKLLQDLGIGRAPPGNPELPYDKRVSINAPPRATPP